MNWQRATRTVYKSLLDPDGYPVRSLNRFKQDPRVKTGPRFDSRDTWSLFDFAAELQRSRKHWFVFQARSRFYAVEARSAREAKRIVEQYRPIRVPQVLVIDQQRERAFGEQRTLSTPAARGDCARAPGADSAQLVGKARRKLLQLFLAAAKRRNAVVPIFRN